MKCINRISVERLREVLSYDPQGGKFYWRVDRPNGVTAGSEALGYIDNKGYRRVKIDGVSCKLHRVAWALSHDNWPNQIDHVNGKKDDNRLENLRLADGTQNNANKRKLSNNSSGYKGVSFYKRHKLWMAYISINRHRIHLGYFDNPEAAHSAYCAAALKHFGDYANFG